MKNLINYKINCNIQKNKIYKIHHKIKINLTKNYFNKLVKIHLLDLNKMNQKNLK